MLSIRGQFEERLHTTLISFGFKGGLIAPYKVKYVLDDVSIVLEGKYSNSLFMTHKDKVYEFNTLAQLFDHKFIKAKIRKQKLKKILE